MKVLLFSLLFYLPCNAQEFYSFVENYVPGEIVKYKEDSLMSFEITGRLTETGNSNITTVKCLGYEDNFLLLEETMIDVIATKKTLGKMSADHDTNSLLGIPYTLYVDTLSGLISHIETEHKEYEEQINALVMGMESSMDNKIYPYGKEATDVRVGDSWTLPVDSLKFYEGDDGAESLMIVESTFTFDKIKNKGGHKIAYLKAAYKCSAELEFMQDTKLFTGSISGTIKDKIRFDLTDNKEKFNKGSGALKWNFRMEGENFSATMDMSTKSKRVN